MYAIVRDGSSQLRVTEGDTVRLAYRADAEPGSTVTLLDVLLVNGEAGMQIGTPLVAGASVQTRVTRQAKDKKLIVYKYRRRKNSATKNGHRQRYTEAVVESIATPNA